MSRRGRPSLHASASKTIASLMPPFETFLPIRRVRPTCTTTIRSFSAADAFSLETCRPAADEPEVQGLIRANDSCFVARESVYEYLSLPPNERQHGLRRMALLCRSPKLPRGHSHTKRSTPCTSSCLHHQSGDYVESRTAAPVSACPSMKWTVDAMRTTRA